MRERIITSIVLIILGILMNILGVRDLAKKWKPRGRGYLKICIGGALLYAGIILLVIVLFS